MYSEQQRTQIYDHCVGVDHQIVGKVGRVTGAIEAGRLGEVMIPVRGGSEAFYAYASDEEAIPKGTRVVVIEYEPPRTVVVSRFA